MKFDMSEAWRDAMAVLAGNREVLLIVAGLFFFLPSVALGLAMGDAEALIASESADPGEALTAIYGQWWWLIIVLTLASMVGSLALLALLRDHSRPTVGEAIKVGLAGLLPAIGAYLLMSVGAIVIILLTFAILGPLLGLDPVNPSLPQFMLVGFIALLILIYPGVKFSLSMPAIAIDKVHNPFKVLGRSWRLTKGNSFLLFLFYVLLSIAYVVIVMAVSMVVGLLTVVLGPDVGQTVNAIVSGALSAAASVVFIAVLAASHRQLSGRSAAAVNETFE